MLEAPHFLVLPFVIANSDLMVIVTSQLAEAFTRLAPLLVMEPPIPIPSYGIRMFWHERFHADPANRWLRATCLVRLQRKPATLPLQNTPAAIAATTPGITPHHTDSPHTAGVIAPAGYMHRVHRACAAGAVAVVGVAS